MHNLLIHAGGSKLGIALGLLPQESSAKRISLVERISPLLDFDLGFFFRDTSTTNRVQVDKAVKMPRGP
jgi:hypothetical protein